MNKSGCKDLFITLPLRNGFSSDRQNRTRRTARPPAVQPMGQDSQIPSVPSPGRQQKGQYHPEHQVGEGGHHEAFHGASAPQDAVGHQLDGNHQIKRSHQPQEVAADFQCVLAGGVQEQAHRGVGEQAVYQREGRHHAHRQQAARPEAPSDPVDFSGAQVLGRKAGQAVRQGGEGGNGRRC